MSTPMDHIAYLSQEIGARPSGTEEEQQAALYITDCLQKEAHLSASIEDFACSTNPGLSKVICHAVAIVAVLLSIVLPVASIPAAVVAFLAAAVLFLETFDKPTLSQAFMKGISQNVVGKYEPVRDPESAGARRRKVILVANYDSGKLRRDLAHPLVSVRRVLDIAVLAASVLIPVFLLICGIAFGGVQGVGAIAIIVIKVILVVIVLIPVVFYILEKTADYNEAANSNAAGVAVMLEVARRLGTGEVSSSPIVSGVMHDEQTAREAGVVPDGATISYESDGAGDGLSAAKAAVAAMTGGAVHHGVRDIADNLVQVKDAPIAAPDAAAMSKARQDTREALASAPAGTLAEAAAKAAALHEQAEQRAAEEAASIERAAQEAELAAAEEQRAAEEAEAARVAAEAEAAKPASVPDWYKKATEKARIKAEQSGEQEDTAQYRSRYADFPSDNHEEPAEEPTPAEAAVQVETSVEEQASSQVEEAVSRETTEAAAAATEVEPAAAPAAEAHEASPAGATGAMPAVHATAHPNETTAMPALGQQGSLDLDALRAAVQAGAPADDAQQAPQVAQPAPASDISGAETTRLPQMMYYTPPADREDVMRDRAQKDRVTVSAEGLDQAATMDAAEVAPQDAYAHMPLPNQAEVAAAAPVVSRETVPASADQAAPQAAAQGRVFKANIPVVDLPQITLPPITAPELKPVSFEEFRQRAPLANVADAHGQDAAKSLLATTLPSIEGPDADATVGMPAVQEKPQNVSLTGSFAAVEAIGSKPVGDELVDGLDPEDIYVDDADDSAFDAEFTETGAFAGPGYVEMPQSRVGKFFGKFRRKNKKAEESTHDWLGVDEDFDARSVGKARGGWESFRDEEDDWNGGAFSNLRARMGRGGAEPVDEHDHEMQEHVESRRAMDAGPAVSADEFAAVAAIAASKASKEESVAPVPHADFEDVQQIYSFASGDINTEVWFVALGSELAEQGGIKAFLADHASDMRGAIIVNLESLGAGELCYLEYEGMLKQMKCSPRMKRFIRKATQASGVDIQGATVNWRESPASFAMKHRAQAVTLAGMDGNKPALMGEADDVIENIDEESLNRAADFVVELLKNI